MRGNRIWAPDQEELNKGDKELIDNRYGWPDKPEGYDTLRGHILQTIGLNNKFGARSWSRKASSENRGGYIMAPPHLLQPDISLENILAMYGIDSHSESWKSSC